jgi:hypothetical protein
MKAMNATQQLKAAALFSLGLVCAATLSVIAGKPAATTIALQPAATAPLAPLGIVTTVATEHIPTVTIVGKRMSKAEKIGVAAIDRTVASKKPGAGNNA